MGMTRRSFLSALAATSAAVISGSPFTRATAAQTAFNRAAMPGNHPQGWHPHDTLGNEINLNATPIVLVEPHLDDKELWLSFLLRARNFFHVHGVIPQSPAAVAASMESMGAHGPFGQLRPFDSQPVVPIGFQKEYRAPDFDQDFYSKHVLPIRYETSEERDIARARRDLEFATPEKVMNALRPAMKALIASGARDFFTLNPVGTYGHPHHITLSEAVARLAVDIYEETGIPVQVWHDTTLRRDPYVADPTGKTLYKQLLDLPGVHYIGPFEVNEDAIQWAREIYKNHFLDPDYGIDAFTWHETGFDYAGHGLSSMYVFNRVGFNPQTGRIDDVMTREGDAYDALRDRWDKILMKVEGAPPDERVGPSYVNPPLDPDSTIEISRSLPEAHRFAEKRKALDSALRNDPVAHTSTRTILAPHV